MDGAPKIKMGHVM